MMTTNETKATETATPVTTYKAARAAGKDQVEACRAVRAAHPGISLDDVADLCWLVEKGKRAPKWQNEDGSPTAAALAWNRGAERKVTGEE